MPVPSPAIIALLATFAPAFRAPPFGHRLVLSMEPCWRRDGGEPMQQQ